MTLDNITFFKVNHLKCVYVFKGMAFVRVVLD